MAKKNIENVLTENLEKLNNLSIVDLNAYENACKMICFQYEKLIKLDEIERKITNDGTMKANREKFQKYTLLHRNLCLAIENKLDTLL